MTALGLAGWAGAAVVVAFAIAIIIVLIVGVSDYLHKTRRSSPKNSIQYNIKDGK